MLFGEFVEFVIGDIALNMWIYCTKDAVTGKPEFANGYIAGGTGRPILRSSGFPTGPPYRAKWFNRANVFEDPLLSVRDVERSDSHYVYRANSLNTVERPGTRGGVVLVRLSTASASDGLSGPVPRGTCAACAPGTYYDLVYNRTQPVGCLACPAHTFSASASTDRSACSCNAGFTPGDALGQCVACAAGAFKRRHIQPAPERDNMPQLLRGRAVPGRQRCPRGVRVPAGFRAQCKCLRVPGVPCRQLWSRGRRAVCRVRGWDFQCV